MDITTVGGDGFFLLLFFFFSSGTPSSSRFDVTKAAENYHENVEMYEERGVEVRGVTASAGSMSAEIFFRSPLSQMEIDSSGQQMGLAF